MSAIDSVLKWNSMLEEYRNKYPDSVLFETKGSRVFGYLRMNRIVDINSDYFVSCFFKDVNNDSEVEVLIPESLVSNVSRILKGDSIVVASYVYNLRFMTDNDEKTWVILSKFSVVNCKKEIGVDDKDYWVTLN